MESFLESNVGRMHFLPYVLDIVTTGRLARTSKRLNAVCKHNVEYATMTLAAAHARADALVVIAAKRMFVKSFILLLMRIQYAETVDRVCRVVGKRARAGFGEGATQKPVSLLMLHLLYAYLCFLVHRPVFNGDNSAAFDNGEDETKMHPALFRRVANTPENITLRAPMSKNEAFIIWREELLMGAIGPGPEGKRSFECMLDWFDAYRVAHNKNALSAPRVFSCHVLSQLMLHEQWELVYDNMARRKTLDESIRQAFPWTISTRAVDLNVELIAAAMMSGSEVAMKRYHHVFERPTHPDHPSSSVYNHLMRTVEKSLTPVSIAYFDTLLDDEWPRGLLWEDMCYYYMNNKMDPSLDIVAGMTFGAEPRKLHDRRALNRASAIADLRQRAVASFLEREATDRNAVPIGCNFVPRATLDTDESMFAPRSDPHFMDDTGHPRYVCISELEKNNGLFRDAITGSLDNRYYKRRRILYDDVDN